MNDSVLNSWKEIASYLGRGIRTVQRWEQFLGLPVRRPHGRDRSSVIALKSEIDDWLEKTPRNRRVRSADIASLRTAFELNRQRLRRHMQEMVEHSRRTQDLAKTIAELSLRLRDLQAEQESFAKRVSAGAS